jgi:hypothetical protein
MTIRATFAKRVTTATVQVDRTDRNDRKSRVVDVKDDPTLHPYAFEQEIS